MVEQDRRQVQSVQNSVTRRTDASESQAGSKQIHDIGKLETHLHESKGFKSTTTKKKKKSAISCNLSNFEEIRSHDNFTKTSHSVLNSI